MLPVPLLVVIATGCNPIHAQDTRKVSEPMIPPVCAVVAAKLDYRNDRMQETRNSAPDTIRIQQAIDRCRPGHAVELRQTAGHNALLIGPLTLRAGVTLLIDKDVHLVASNRPEDYDRQPGSCGLSEKGSGCRPLLTADQAHHSGIMGEGTIEGRGDQKMAGSDMSWWQMHQMQGDVHRNIPWLIGTNSTDDFTLYEITLRNAPNFNIFLQGGNGITIWGIKIDAPGNSPNTDGIDPSGSTNVTITRSYIRNGDDNIAIKAPRGQPATRMTISHDHFYEGHGMSIGSGTEGGVSGIRFTDITIDHQKSGIHIKSNPGRGGLVTDVIYDGICIRNTATPIHFESTYVDANAPRDKWIHETKIPIFAGIILRNIQTSGGTRLILRGMDSEHRTEVQLDGVQISGIDQMKQQAQHARVELGPGPSNWIPNGDDVVVSGTPSSAALPSCTSRFIDFPQ
jgi:polygalacturonase